MTHITTDMSTLVIFGTQMLQNGEDLGFWAASEILTLTTEVNDWRPVLYTPHPETKHECNFWQAFGEMFVAAMLSDAKRTVLIHALCDRFPLRRHT